MTAAILIKRTRRIFRRYRKLFRLLGWIAGIVFLIFYLLAFFSQGVVFMDHFLRKASTSSAITYSGQDPHGPIVLTVRQTDKSTTSISYQLPYNKLKTYTLTLAEIQRKNPDLPVEYSLTIHSGDGSLLFDGKYQRGSPFLYSKAGAAVNTDIEPYRNPENPWLNFEPNLRRMVAIALGEYDQQRGDWFCFLLGIGVLALLWADVRRPLISGKLRELFTGLPDRLANRLLLAVRLAVLITGFGLMMAAL